MRSEEIELPFELDKESRELPFDINKIEFWGATILFVLSIFILVSGAARQGLTPGWGPNDYQFQEHNLKYSYYANYMVPMLFRNTFFYGAYLLLTFYLFPRLINRRNIALNIIITLAVFAIIGIACGVTDTWLKGYLYAVYDNHEEVEELLTTSNATFAFWLMLIFSFYSAIKYMATYLYTHSDKIQEKYQAITRDGIIAFILWMFTFFLLLISNAPREVLGVYGLVIPIAIGLYWFSLHSLIPNVQNRKRKFLTYIWHVILLMLVCLLPVSLIAFGLFNEGSAVVAVNAINTAFQVFFTAPLSWLIYRQRSTLVNQLVSLKTALGRSSATLDSLRSQINPHFLFNALNTLYGTSLQENAERTSEGIQKLGDMMRFMLEENMQDKITLNREIDYINNYISLQKLRTQTSPDIEIQTNIDDQVNNLLISPMLLIPFIENAFKHGISLREKSHIKITLHISGNDLFFDVYNSMHQKPEIDPEKYHHGIGLENVKKRLQLLYPKKHELIIRENANEYFIHLTMQLA
jgi:two-component system, LytTR family, sensor kinase